MDFKSLVNVFGVYEGCYWVFTLISVFRTEPAIYYEFLKTVFFFFFLLHGPLGVLIVTDCGTKHPRGICHKFSKIRRPSHAAFLWSYNSHNVMDILPVAVNVICLCCLPRHAVISAATGRVRCLRWRVSAVVAGIQFVQSERVGLDAYWGGSSE